MSDFFDITTILAICAAVVVLFRLRSVLGTRTGHERPPSDRIREKSRSKGAEDKVIDINAHRAEPLSDGEEERRNRKLEAEIELFARGNETVAQGLRDIGAADSAFLPKSFLEGAKSAYEMIVTAFAAGDRKALKNLVEKDVYDGFEQAIAEREAQGHTNQFTFVGLPGIEITDAELDKRIAQVTIRFDAEVVSAILDKDGELLEGNSEQVTMISDEWCFARNTRSRDPNWKLVATNQVD